MKKSKIIAPALGVLVLSTAASITGTVAWFTANNSVSVTGMVVKTKVSSNILIAEDTISSTAKLEDSYFGSGPLNQAVKGILEPASTINGTAFYYTTDAKADGDAKSDAYVQYGAEAALTGDDATNYQDAFSKAYALTKTAAGTLITGETGAKPYVDYVFQLRAQNLEATAVNLKVSNLTLTYGAAADAGKAYRVALFAEDISLGTATASATGLVSILKKSDAAYFTADSAVSSTSALTTVTRLSANANLASIESNATKYYKVVVRLWLEGEDTTCNNATYAALTNSWSLALDIDMGTGSGVDALTTAVNA